MKNKESKGNTRDLKSILAIVLAIVVVTFTGTFAWLSYRTNDTAMVLTIGDVDGLMVSLKPYQINGSITPVSNYTGGNVINVTAANSNVVSDGFNLYYQIESIDQALKSSYFKYTVTRSTNGGSSYSVVKNGNFSTAQSNSTLSIHQDTVPSGSTYLYKVYLWIDTSGGNQSNICTRRPDRPARFPPGLRPRW